MAKIAGGKTGAKTEPEFQNPAEEIKYWKGRYEEDVKYWKGRYAAECGRLQRKIDRLEKENAALKRKNIALDNAVSGLQKTVGDTAQALEQVNKEGKASQEVIQKLSARLSRVDGAHTPTSHQMFRKPKPRKGTGKKRGGQPGHPGATDTRPATHKVRARFPMCGCGTKWVDVTKVKKRSILDIPVVKYEKIEITELEGTCVGCGKTVSGKCYVDYMEPVDDAGAGAGAVTGGGRGGAPPPAHKSPVPPPGGNAGMVEMDMGGGMVQLVKREDSVAVGDMLEAEDNGEKEELAVPKRGKMGLNLLHIILAEWFYRGTVGKIQDKIRLLYSLGLSTATIYAALERMTDCLQPETDAILQELLKSPYLHIDETSFYLDRVKRWVWVVATRERCYYFVSSRKMTRIKEMLKDYKGIIIVDGYHTYKMFPPEQVQRCTVHIGRDLEEWADEEAEKTPHRRTMRNFASRMKALIHCARRLKKDGLGPQSHSAVCAEFDRIIEYYSRYPEISKRHGKIKNAGHRLFTFMLYEYVDSTNNLAERLMREVVKHRAIRGTLRTQKGGRIFGTLMTVCSTHKYASGKLEDLLKKYMVDGATKPPIP